MGIYDPRIFFSKDDRELLSLLSNLAISYSEQEFNRNTPKNHIPLSDNECLRLTELLERFVSSKKFVEGSYLVEHLFGGGSLYDNTLRDIYLSGRKASGRTRAMATVQWENFLGRLGIWTNTRGNPRVWYQASAGPMDMDYFLRMERKLTEAVALHPRVRALVLDFVKARTAALDQIRQGDRKLKFGEISEPPRELLASLREKGARFVSPDPIPVPKLVGIITLVMDFGTLFTTRDWSVTSVLSATAAAIPPIIINE